MPSDLKADLKRLVELQARCKREPVGAATVSATALMIDFAAVLEQLEELEMDSANYRGRCSECKASCMDMLTDDHCAQCTFISMEGDFAEYEHATRQRIAELEAEVERLREVRGNVVWRAAEGEDE